MAKPFSPFVDGLLDLLATFGTMSARRMFGGYGIYRDGVFFALVDDDVVYFKVDDANRSAFEQAGQRPFTIEMNGREETMSYWTVPDEALDSPARLRPWAQLGWEAACRAAEKKQAKAARKAPRGVPTSRQSAPKSPKAKSPPPKAAPKRQARS